MGQPVIDSGAGGGLQVGWMLHLQEGSEQKYHGG